MKKSIGIDLGTTNSVVSFRDTVVKILRNKENEELTRSCVGIRNNEIYVGSLPFKNLARDPINTVLSVKRLMGAALNDSMVQDMINNPYYNYEITKLKGGTNDAVALVLGGKQYTPEQLSAEILKKLKRDAEEKLGEEVSHAVITVPAYFTEKQKNATRIAAELAGLKVKKLLPEPTAAAIAYGIDTLKPGEAKSILIYDFGGGTFDLSILNIVDGNYMEMGTGGDRWLGGDNLDRKLQEIIENKTAKKYGISDLGKLIEKLDSKKQHKYKGLMRAESEKAKIELSSASNVDFILDNILEDEEGEIIDIQLELSRSEFEEAIKPLVIRSMDLIDGLLKQVGYDISMIDAILLVGGTSCVPLIKQMMAEKYGVNKVKVSERPMLAVAEGAAILAQRLGDDYEPVVGEIPPIDEISYTANHNYFIEKLMNHEEIKELIIERQTNLPAEKTVIVKTTMSNQKLAKVALFSDVEDGEYEQQCYGYYIIDEDLPIASELIFEIRIDSNEIFNVSAYPRGKAQKIKSVLLGRGYADQKALTTIEEMVIRSVEEMTTSEGEREIVNFITDKLREAEVVGINNITDEKWHELYYTITEKFEEIKGTEEGSSVLEREMYRAKSLIAEFGDLIEPFERNAMIKLITILEEQNGVEESDNALDQLTKRNQNYAVLHASIQISGLANRILSMPVVAVGDSQKKIDVDRLIKLHPEIKTAFLMHNNERAKNLLDEAYQIINKYL